MPSDAHKKTVRPGPMTDILVPLSPVDLMDHLVRLQMSADRMADLDHKAELHRQADVFQRAIDRTTPLTKVQQGLCADLRVAKSDLQDLKQDLDVFDSRSDFGSGYIALARAYFDCSDEEARIKDALAQSFQAAAP